VDLSAYRTFDFKGGQSVTKMGAVETDNPLVSERVKEAVTRQLEAKGLRPVGGAAVGDLHVTFMAGARERTQLESFGPSYYFGGGWFGWGPGWWGPGYEDWWARTYTEGTLIVDLIDSHSRKLVWRAYARAEIDDPVPGGELIDREMARAFEDFPPSAPRRTGSAG
jgi:hypothetical protein